MLHERYYVEKEKQEKLLSRKNVKSDFYNGVYDRYEYPVLTREHIPLTWRYDLNPETNPYFMERLGINAVMNSGAIELNGKYYLVARIEGNDRKSFFGVAESDNGIDGFRFWDYPILLPDTCSEETNVYDMRLTKHEDANDVFGIKSEGTEVTAGELNKEGYKEVAQKLTDRFGFKKVAITLRTSISANDNRWAAMLYEDGQSYFSKEYLMHIVDRVGGGDSFGGGLIYACLNDYAPQDTIEFAVAASCLKHSVEGDFNMVSVDEVKKLAGGDASGRVQR